MQEVAGSIPTGSIDIFSCDSMVCGKSFPCHPCYQMLDYTYDCIAARYANLAKQKIFKLKPRDYAAEKHQFSETNQQ
jgi:hypothetical protein